MSVVVVLVGFVAMTMTFANNLILFPPHATDEERNKKPTLQATWGLWQKRVSLVPTVSDKDKETQ
eukprot:4757306-Ditylum_brightwellii.AAC.1